MARPAHGQSPLALLGFFLAKPATILYPMAMDQSSPTSPSPAAELSAFRAQIDALDDQIVELLIRRIGIVEQVGKMKQRNYPGQCPIRAGREADMVRRIVKKFEGSGFSSAAGAALWRILIGASTAIESPLSLSVLASEHNDTLYWLGREYFGPFIPATRHTQAKRVIGDVQSGKASVGILPTLRNNDENAWWQHLLQSGPSTPKIFAHIPFVHYGKSAANAPAGLAIACTIPEPTGDDISLLVIEADHNLSQHRLQTACNAVQLSAHWISIATIHTDTRCHLIEMKGFIDSSCEALLAMKSSLSDSIKQVSFLGAYAMPIIVPIS